MKGQARKAKAKAASGDAASIGRDGIMQMQTQNTCICKHGLEESNATSFECNNFIDTFFQFFSKNILRLTNPGSTAKLTAAMVTSST